MQMILPGRLTGGSSATSDRAKDGPAGRRAAAARSATSALTVAGPIGVMRSPSRSPKKLFWPRRYETKRMDVPSVACGRFIDKIDQHTLMATKMVDVTESIV